MQRFINLGLTVGMVISLGLAIVAWRRDGGEHATSTRPNVLTSFNPDINDPRVGEGTYIDSMASVIGDVRIGRRVMVAPFASVRGDEGQPIRIGSRTNIQDGVVLHALETMERGEPIEGNLVEHNGKKYAIYIGDEVSLAHQSQVHGPAKVGDRVFVGMQALVFKTEIGEGSVVEPGAKVIGVKIASGRYVPAGAVITQQSQADALPAITPDYVYRTLNDGVIHVNTQLADGYNGNGSIDPEEDVPVRRPAATPAPATKQTGTTGQTTSHQTAPTPAPAGGTFKYPTPAPTPAAARNSH